MAKSLLSMQLNSKGYVLVKGLFTRWERRCLRVYQTTLPVEDMKPVNFSDERLVGRYQQQFYQSNIGSTCPVAVLEDFLTAIRMCLPNQEYIKGSFLISIPPCNPQPLHADDDALYRASQNTKVPWQHVSFSIIVALEETGNLKEKNNPTHIIMENRQSPIRLKPGDVILIRGDQRHAGSGYHRLNRRLFISVGSKEFKNEGETTGGLDENYVVVPVTRSPNRRTTSRRTTST